MKVKFFPIILSLLLIFSHSFAFSSELPQREIISSTTENTIKEIVGKGINMFEILLKTLWAKRGEIYQYVQEVIRFGLEIIKSFFFKIEELIEKYISHNPFFQKIARQFSETLNLLKQKWLQRKR